MAISELITRPEDAHQRSAYPSLSQPGMVEGRYVARFRLADDVLSPETAHAFAEIVETAQLHVAVTPYGALEISSADASGVVAAAGQIKQTLPISDELPITHSASPSAHSLAADLSAKATPLKDRLSPALRIVIDETDALAGLRADISLIAQEEDLWAVTLGGGKPQILDRGTALATTLAMLSALAALGPEAGSTDLFVPYGSNAEPASDTPKSITVDVETLKHLARDADQLGVNIHILPLQGLVLDA